MRICNRTLWCVAAGLLSINFQAADALAANFYPVITDMNAVQPAFGIGAAAVFGGVYTADSNAMLNSNDVLAFNQNNACGGCGAVMEINVSNGENGVDSTEGGTNTDVPNPTPANPAFAAIGNASGKLENGNVLRFSVWVRSDPANPITKEPQVAPLIKFEFWKEALSINQDAGGNKVAPTFGDRVFDQDQQGHALTIPDLPHYVDVNGDGVADNGTATVGNGRITPLATDHWSLATVTYTVDSSQWFGIGPEAFAANDVTKIESVKAVFFMGDFANTDLTGDGADGGNFLLDNALVEVFKNAAAVTPNLNPDPGLAVGLTGDYNHNGVVDAADYVVWRKGGSPIPNSVADYNAWRANFGNHTGSGVGAQAVPEPSVMMLAIAAVLSLASAYRRR